MLLAFPRSGSTPHVVDTDYIIKKSRTNKTVVKPHPAPFPLFAIPKGSPVKQADDGPDTPRRTQTLNANQNTMHHARKTPSRRWSRELADEIASPAAKVRVADRNA